jgi:metal-responsive CopG/Arc/MetJ family transcriptional regulator
MKTAISVPDDVYREAEATARRLGISRSELYSTAMRNYLQNQHGKKQLLENLNAVYGDLETDQSIEEAARVALLSNEWQ